MSGHTPGPWKPGYRLMNVVAENTKIGGEVPVCDIRGWGYLTGKGHGALGLSQDEAVAIQTANANLIAAAPDMFAALELMVEEFRQLDLPYGSSGYLAATEAIAKAEGRT